MNQAVQSALGLFVPAMPSAWPGLQAGTALRRFPGRGSSWEHSYFEVQVKETPIFSEVGDLLTSNCC